MSSFRTLLSLSFLLIGIPNLCRAAEPAAIRIEHPVPYQVIQREGFDPVAAHDHNPGGPALGFASVAIRYKNPVSGAILESRVIAIHEAAAGEADWKPLEVDETGEGAGSVVRVPAGGWYRLELRQREGDQVVAKGEVEPFGVGEVFVVAGQSYASNANDESLTVEDPRKRVAAYNWRNGAWAVANDPQPTSDESQSGSIWPAFGDDLVPMLRVPVGLVNVSYGGTSSGQWLPGQPLHERLCETGRKIGRFRAVLWQQGESDVIGHVATADYVRNLKAIHDEAVKAWGIAPPWLLAKSTLHPTVYNDPEGEGRIRAAIDELCALPGFEPGPDTDILAGENRGDVNSRRHFTGIGQRRAAMLWFSAVWGELNRAEAPGTVTAPTGN